MDYLINLISSHHRVKSYLKKKKFFFPPFLFTDLLPSLVRWNHTISRRIRTLKKKMIEQRGRLQCFDFQLELLNLQRTDGRNRIGKVWRRRGWCACSWPLPQTDSMSYLGWEKIIYDLETLVLWHVLELLGWLAKIQTLWAHPYSSWGKSGVGLKNVSIWLSPSWSQSC